jgi:hypothetical protein
MVFKTNFMTILCQVLIQAKSDFCHSKQAKTDLLQSKIFQSGQNRLSSCQAKRFQSGKNQLPTFHAIPVRPKSTFPIPSHSSQSNIVNSCFLFSLPCRSWSPNYSILVRNRIVLNVVGSGLNFEEVVIGTRL